MSWDLAGMGNALMDALVVLDDDALIAEMGLVRGTMHPVDHDRWQAAYERVRRHKVTFDSGGSCANSVAAAGLLGARTVFYGQVGDDQMGQLYASRLTEACGRHALRFSERHATGKCLSIISAADAERTMLTDLGAAVAIPELGAFAADLRDTRIGHFEGYMLLAPDQRQLVLEGMHHCREAGGLVSLDVSDPFVVLQLRDLMWSLIDRYVDIVFLNAEEARALTGLEPEEAGRNIAQECSVRTVVVKLGSRGSVILHDGAEHAIGVHTVHAIDTTGAGDAYAGGFLYAMGQGWPAQRCGELASAVAAQTVSQIGAVVKDVAVLHGLRDGLAPAPVT